MRSDTPMRFSPGRSQQTADDSTSKGTFMRKRWMLIAGVVAVVAALLVGGQLIMNGNKAPAGPQMGATSDGKPFSVVSTAPAGNDATSSAIPPLPKSQVGLKAIEASGPLTAGEPLPPLTASPPGLITSFQEGLVPSGSAYNVTLRPWGLGPNDPAGRTAVVTIDTITPSGAAPDKFVGLKRRAIFVVMNAKAGGTLERGGSYSAVLSFVAAGGHLVPTISDAHLATP